MDIKHHVYLLLVENLSDSTKCPVGLFWPIRLCQPFSFLSAFPHRRDLTAGAAAVWRSWSTGSRSADRQKSPGVYLGRLSRRVQNNSVSAGMAGSVVPNGEESREKRSIT